MESRIYVRMIEPKTEAGIALKIKYEKQILELKTSGQQFPVSGANSLNEKIKGIMLKYNYLLAMIETVSQEDATEAHRPQMEIPRTDVGIALKERYLEQILEVENSQNSFPRSGPLSKYQQVNALRVKFNEALSEAE